MLKNTPQSFRQLQSFTTVTEMDRSISAHFKTFGAELTPTAKRILNLIATHACKYVGVCYLAKTTMAEMLDVNVRTVRRCCNQLEKLGIIVQYEMKRAGGDKRQTSSAIVVQSCPSAMSAHKSSIKTKDLNNTSDTDKAVSVDKESLVKHGLKTKLPNVLQRALAPFFDTDELYTMTGVVFKAKASVDRSISLEDNEQEYYNAILSVMNTVKRSKVRNLQGLLYHAVKATTRSIWIKERARQAYGI